MRPLDILDAALFSSLRVCWPEGGSGHAAVLTAAIDHVHRCCADQGVDTCPAPVVLSLLLPTVDPPARAALEQWIAHAAAFARCTELHSALQQHVAIHLPGPHGAAGDSATQLLATGLVTALRERPLEVLQQVAVEHYGVLVMTALTSDAAALSNIIGFAVFPPPPTPRSESDDETEWSDPSA